VRHPKSEPKIFTEASKISASRRRAIVSKLKEEKVVKPPRIPMVRKILRDGSAMNLSSKIAINKPIRKQPMRFTERVQ
jgi:hypothetical protein